MKGIEGPAMEVPWRIKPLVADVKKMLLNLENPQVVKIDRNANKAVDLVAKLMLQGMRPMNWAF